MKITTNYITKSACLFTILTGLLVIAGWIFNISFFKSVLPGIVSMKFNAAIVFILSGFTLYLLDSSGENQTRKNIARIFSWIILLNGLLVISENIFNRNFGISELFWKEGPGAIATEFPGQMSLGTSILFVMLGFIFLTIGKRKYLPIILLLLFGMIAGCLLVILNHLLGTSFLTLIANISSTALHSAILVIVLSVGIFFSSFDLYLGLSFQKKITAFFLIVSFAILMIFFAYEKTREKSVNNAAALISVREMLLKAEELSSRVYEMQSSVNGFIITGDEYHLALFNPATDTVHKIVGELYLMTKDKVGEQVIVDSLEKLIGNYIISVRKMINVRRHEGFEAAHKLFQESKETSTIGQISLLQLALENEENLQLLKRKTENENSIKNSSRIIRVFQIFTVLFLLLAFLVIYKNNRKRNELEAALQKSLKENPDYKYALDESSIISITDQDGVIIHANDNFCKISKYRREELIGQKHRIVNSGYHSKEFFRNMWATIRSGQIWRGEIRNRARDESVYWVDATIVPFLTEQGKPYQYLAIRNDISERKKAEDKLRENEFALSEAQRIAQMGSWVYDMNGNIKWSEETYRIHGLSPGDYKPDIESFIRILNPDDQTKLQKWINSCFAGEKPGEIEYRIILADGTIRYLAGNGELKVDAQNKPQYLAGIILDITDKKIVEEKLKKEKELSENIINSLPGVFYISDKTPRLLRWNRRLEEVTGYPEEELGSISPITLFDPDDHHAIKQSLQKTYLEGSAVVEARIKTKSDQKIPYYFTGVRIIYEGKEAILGTGIDISEMKKAEKSLSESHQRYKNLLDNMNDGLIVDDISGKIIFANNNFLKIYGFTAQDLNNLGFEDYVAPEYVKMIRDRHKSRMAGETVSEVFEFEGTHKDGKRVWIETHVSPIIENGIFTGTQSMLRDITERKKSDALYKESEEKYRQIVETTQEGVWMIDTNSYTTFVNNRMGEMLGYSVEEMKGKHLYDFMNEEGKRIAEENINRRMQGIKEQHDFTFQTKDGKAIWTLIETSPMFKDGEYAGALAMVMDISERKKSEGEKERLLNVLQKSLNEIYIFNTDTLKFEYVNDGARKNLGYSLEEMQEMTPIDIKPEYTPDKFRKLIAPVMNAEKGKIIFETIHKRKDNSLYPVEVHLQLMSYLGQSVFLAVILDITERKNAEKEIKKSIERFELIAQATNDALWDWNLETGELWGNEIHQQLYGLKIGDPVPTDTEWKGRIHPEDREKTVKILNDLMASRIRSFSEEYRFYTENKGWMNVFGRTLVDRNEKGKPVRLVGSMMDITESKKAAEKLTESEEKFRTLVQQAADGIFLVDTEGNYLEANQSAAIITGYTIDELKKMNAADIVDKEDLKRTPLKLEEIKKGSTVFLERIITKKDGTPVHVDISAKLMDNGKVIVIMRDTTDRKEAEEKLNKFAAELQASNTELERFAYIASHDLQEPLRMINSFMNLLEEELEGKLNETSKEYIHFIIDGSVRMKTLINDLLLYSRIGGNKQEFTTVDLNQVIKYATHLLEEDIKRNKGILKISKLPAITGDKTLIGQLLINLLSNALKYHCEKDPAINVGYTEEQDQFVFYVKDNGIGIDSKYFEKIFIIFQRLHNKNEYSGTGIGLAICKKIVEIHKGQIWIESEAGKGSTFYFSIPKK